MKKIFFIIMLTWIFQKSHAQQWEWAKKQGGNGNDRGQLIACDPDGNVFVTGIFSDTIILGSQMITENNGNTFLAKYDPSGNLLWNIQLNQTETWDLKADAQYVYLCGGYSAGATIGTNMPANKGDKDAFVARITTSGVVNLLLTGNGTGRECTRGVDIDMYGNMYATGFYGDTAVFSSIVLNGNTATNYYVIKYDATGNILWTSTATQSTHSVFGNNITVSKNGNCIYVKGDAGGSSGLNGIDSVNFNNGSIYFQSPVDVSFIAKYNSGGNLLLVKGVLNDYKNSISGIDQDVSENLFIGVSNLYSSYDIKKFDPSLNLLWTISDPLCGSEAWIADIEVDDGGNVFAAGSFRSPACFSGDTLNAGASFYNSYVVKYNGTGLLQWVEQVNAAADGNSGEALCRDDAGNIFVAGAFFDKAVFDSLTLTSSGGSDMYVAKINPEAITASVENSFTDDELKIYPNPSTGKFQFSFNNKNGHLENVKVSIYNFTGEQIASLKSVTEKSEIDLSRQPQGIYFVEIISKYQRKTKKLVIE